MSQENRSQSPLRIAFVLGLVLVIALVGIFFGGPGEDSSRAKVQSVPVEPKEVASLEAVSPPPQKRTQAEPLVKTPSLDDLKRKEARRERLKKKAKEKRDRSISRIASLGHNSYEAERIQKLWEAVEEKMRIERAQIKEELGPLAFSEMRAADRAILNDFFEDVSIEEYEAALYGAEKATTVRLGTVEGDSMAAELGLQQGDRLLSWCDLQGNCSPIFNLDDMSDLHRASQRNGTDQDPAIFVFEDSNGQVFNVEAPNQKNWNSSWTGHVE